MKQCCIVFLHTILQRLGVSLYPPFILFGLASLLIRVRIEVSHAIVFFELRLPLRLRASTMRFTRSLQRMDHVIPQQALFVSLNLHGLDTERNPQAFQRG